MSNLSYKGYSSVVEFEADSDVFVGRLVGISDIVVFEADNVEGLKSAFAEAVDDYIDHCAKIGKDPQKAYSGKLMLRISPETHAKIAMASELSKAKSMNEYAESILHKEAEAFIDSLAAS